jgi:hypothetical protein
MIEETIRIKIEADGADKVDKALGTLDALEQKAKDLNIIPEAFKVPDFAKKLIASSAEMREHFAEAAKFAKTAQAMKPPAAESKLAALSRSEAKAAKLYEAARRNIPEAPPRMSALLAPGTYWKEFYETREILTGGKHVGYPPPSPEFPIYQFVKAAKEAKTPHVPNIALDPKYTGPYERIPGKPSPQPFTRSSLPPGLTSAILAYAGTAALGRLINEHVPGLKGSASKYFGKGELGKHFGEFALGSVPGGAYAMTRTLIDKFNPPKPFIGPRPPPEKPLKRPIPEPVDLPVTPDIRTPKFINEKPLSAAQIWKKIRHEPIARPAPAIEKLYRLEHTIPEPLASFMADVRRHLPPPSSRFVEQFNATPEAMKPPTGTYTPPPTSTPPPPGRPTPTQPPPPHPVTLRAGNTYHINIHQIADKIEAGTVDEDSLMKLLGNIVKNELPY